MYLSFRWKLAAAFIAGAFLTFAYAPFNQFWIAPLSFAALMLLWRAATARDAFLTGFFFGIGSFLGGIHWVYISIHDFGQAHPLFAASLTLALVAGMSLYAALTGWLAARFFLIEGPRAWLGVIPALWVLTEWSRGWLLSGFGWLAAGYSQTESWLMGYAAIGGVYFISWAVLVTAGAVVTLYAGSTRARAAAVVLALTFWVGALAAGRMSWTDPRESFLSVALVQGAVRQDQKWLPSEFIPTLDEGAIAMQIWRLPSISLEESNRISTRAEQVIKAEFPEVDTVISRTVAASMSNACPIVRSRASSRRAWI